MTVMLALRTDKPEAELYLYDGDKRLNEINWSAHRQLAETIHLKIDEFLSLQGLTLQDLEKIGVYLGPGSFTGLRIGISVANALSYGLDIPVVGGIESEWLDSCIKESGDKIPLVPVYGSEPHITQQKK